MDRREFIGIVGGALGTTIIFPDVERLTISSPESYVEAERLAKMHIAPTFRREVTARLHDGTIWRGVVESEEVTPDGRVKIVAAGH